VQHVLNSGGTPVGVVSSARKVEILHELGCDIRTGSSGERLRFWKDAHTQDESEWRRFGKGQIRARWARTPDIVFEHPGDDRPWGQRSSSPSVRHDPDLRRTSGLHGRYDNRHCG